MGHDELHSDDARGDGDESVEPLLSRGNPLHWRGVLPLVLGLSLGIFTAASDATPRVGVAVGSVAALLSALGLLDVLGTFDDDPDEVVTWRGLLPAVLLSGLSTFALWLVLCAAVRGSLSVTASALAVPTTFIALLIGVYRVGERLGPWRVDERGERRQLHRRHGFWLLTIGSVIHLPMLGNHSLLDPWETHYGEVAREILARDDWISLWWAHDGWFWSKPVLLFWLESIAMALLGVRYEAGEMLSAAAEGFTPQPEWALRMTIMPFALLGAYLLYKAVAQRFGRRAGFFGGLVLLTMPQYFLIAHQAMTDMLFVGGISAAVALFLMAIAADPDEPTRVYGVRVGSLTVSVSLYHLVMGALLIIVVPQIAYLVSRNLEMVLEPHFDVRFVADSFNAGSGGNCGLPGNKPCQQSLTPAAESLQPAVQSLLWIQVLALLAWMNWGERRRQRLLFLAAWLCAALATMSKGPAGLGLPVLCAFSYLLATGRWRELLRMEILAGVLILIATVFPWWLAMYVRHGAPFFEQLFVHDMFKRAFRHVHDTNTGDDISFRYYVWQLGYATFPWVGLAPIALVRWLRGGRTRSDGGAAVHDEGRGVGYLVLCAWFLIAFALFTAMGTKFHHYILPALPPLAMLVGVLLDRLIVERDEPSDRVMFGALAVGAAVLTAMVGRDLIGANTKLGAARFVHLLTYNYARPWPKSVDFSTELAVFTLVATLLLALMVVARWRERLAYGFTALACVFAMWCINVYFVGIAPHWGQRELLLRYEVEQARVPGPLVAYQMNWKGENFYRGNRIPAFVSSGKVFQDWVDQQKKLGQRRFYFVTEHKRVSGLRGELGQPPHVDRLSDKELNNKFVLVRIDFSQ